MSHKRYNTWVSNIKYMNQCSNQPKKSEKNYSRRFNKFAKILFRYFSDVCGSVLVNP